MTAQGFGHIINVSWIGGLQVSPTAAVYCATKFAVRAISDGLRQENDRLRVTSVCPGVVESELADSISDDAARREMATFRAVALQPDAIGRAILHAINQPADVNTTEIVVRPVGNPAWARTIRSSGCGSQATAVSATRCLPTVATIRNGMAAPMPIGGDTPSWAPISITSTTPVLPPTATSQGTRCIMLAWC